jgi:uncharacterized membrane protein YqaE (UPF0057 family)
MKKLSLFFIAAILGALVMNSCSIEQRYHRTGFNVNWNTTHVKIKKDKNKIDSEIELSDEMSSQNNIIISVKEKNALTYSDLNDNSIAENSGELVLLNENKVNEVPVNSSNKADQKFVEYNSSKVSRKETVNSAKSNSSIKKRIENHSEMKEQIRQKSAFDDDNTILCVVLAFFIPPLAVYLFEGSWTKRCTVNLILTLLCGLPGLIHALVVILGDK